MKLILITLVVAIFTVAKANANDPGLTIIERESCETRSKPVPFESAVQTFDYDIDSEWICDEEGRNCNGYRLKFTLKYKVTDISTYDYFNDLGRLVTSKTERRVSILKTETAERRVGEWNREFDDHAIHQYEPIDDAAKAQAKKLYEILVKRLQEKEARDRWEESVKFCDK